MILHAAAVDEKGCHMDVAPGVDAPFIQVQLDLHFNLS
jgi:hypothetical protein